ncbi:hypothetical protein ARTHRO8AJ_300046 [Arthrobacter sp. 8AJ]|nr:hypothetical protein ARTHRO8AJ_300046 [Arthrobacter sp. 8AJ]
MKQHPRYKQGETFKCSECGSFTTDESLPVETFTGLSYTDYVPSRCSNEWCKNMRPEFPRGWWESAG